MQSTSEEKKEIVKLLLQKSILLNESELGLLEGENLRKIKDIIGCEKYEIETSLKSMQQPCALVQEGAKLQDREAKIVAIVKSHNEIGKKLELNDFVKFFRSRYKKIEKILQKRQKLQNIISISRLQGNRQKEEVSIIGLVADKKTTKNENIVLTIEDPSGTIKAVINKNKHDIYELAKDITLDEVVGIKGVAGDNILFINNIILPEIPVIKELKKAANESYAIFLSDMHVGSNNFLEEKFLRFLKWIKGELGTQAQRDIANKVDYIFIIGDLVDGVGIYPDQDKELQIQDIYLQYKKCAELLDQIPKNVTIIVCPGNHDAVRICEPQPPIKEIAKPLLAIKNIISVSNPALINIHSSANFSGFDILMYHGYSFDYYVANVDSIRLQGGYDRADLIMKFLLQRRHLAPTHSSSLYVPGEDDPLVIEKVPDFFVTGHIHKTSVSTYRNVTLISGSCWQSKTSFQERVGHNPEPCKVPIVNLQTRAIKIMTF